jgi:hypothetical protein
VTLEPFAASAAQVQRSRHRPPIRHTGLSALPLCLRRSSFGSNGSAAAARQYPARFSGQMPNAHSLSVLSLLRPGCSAHCLPAEQTSGNLPWLTPAGYVAAGSQVLFIVLPAPRPPGSLSLTPKDAGRAAAGRARPVRPSEWLNPGKDPQIGGPLLNGTAQYMLLLTKTFQASRS